MGFSEREKEKIRSLAEMQGMPVWDTYGMEEGNLSDGHIRFHTVLAGRLCERWAPHRWTIRIGGRKYAVGQDTGSRTIAYADAGVRFP